MSPQAAQPVDPDRVAAILDARTAALAAPRVKPGAATPGAFQALVVQAGAHRFALPFALLVLALAGRRLHRLPVADAAVTGAVQARGALWIVYDLGRLSGQAACRSDGGRVLLLNHPRRHVALAVDSLAETRRIAPAELGPIGQAAAEGAAFLRRATADGVMLVETPQLLARLDLAGRKTS